MKHAKNGTPQLNGAVEVRVIVLVVQAYGPIQKLQDVSAALIP